MHKSKAAAIAAAAVIVTPRLEAHHSTSAFDMQAPLLTLEGVITRVEWTNPHVYVYMQTDGDAAERWELEGDTPGASKRLGWNRDSFEVGDRIVATAEPPRDPEAHVGHLMSIEKEGGVAWHYLELMGAYLSPPAHPARADSLAGLWQIQLDLNAAFAKEPMILVMQGRFKLTDEGLEGFKAWSEEAMAELDCTPLPPPTATMGDLLAIEIADDTITLSDPEFAITRTIHMNVASHEGASESVLGHSIGSWESGDLVIDTSHFAPHPDGNMGRVPSSSERHLVERLSLAEDHQSLIYSYEYTDPVYLGEPAIFEQRFNFAPDVDVDTVPCSIESARKFLTD
jgi:Family of unknown function (DUF6152)